MPAPRCRRTPLLLVLDLVGTFAFALNGALTAVRTVRLDIVGVITLATITAIGGGILRDVVLGATPPATFSDWRYLTVAAVGGLLAFFLGRLLVRAETTIMVLDAAGLSLFAVTGALKALDYGLGPGQAIILGAVTAVGGGTIRDVLLGPVPAVLHSGLYAIPAVLGAARRGAGRRARAARRRGRGRRGAALLRHPAGRGAVRPERTGPAASPAGPAERQTLSRAASPRPGRPAPATAGCSAAGRTPSRSGRAGRGRRCPARRRGTR